MKIAYAFDSLEWDTPFKLILGRDSPEGDIILKNSFLSKFPLDQFCLESIPINYKFGHI